MDSGYDSVSFLVKNRIYLNKDQCVTIWESCTLVKYCHHINDNSISLLKIWFHPQDRNYSNNKESTICAAKVTFSRKQNSSHHIWPTKRLFLIRKTFSLDTVLHWYKTYFKVHSCLGKTTDLFNNKKSRLSCPLHTWAQSLGTSDCFCFFGGVDIFEITFGFPNMNH